jgi:hypothetical protein
MEGIGAITRAEGKKATARSGNYQDNVTRPLSCDHDDNITADIDPDVIDGDLDRVVATTLITIAGQLPYRRCV